MSLASTCPICHSPSEILFQGHRCATPRCANYDAKVEVHLPQGPELQFTARPYVTDIGSRPMDNGMPPMADNDTVVQSVTGAESIRFSVEVEPVNTSVVVQFVKLPDFKTGDEVRVREEIGKLNLTKYSLNNAMRKMPGKILTLEEKYEVDSDGAFWYVKENNFLWHKDLLEATPEKPKEADYKIEGDKLSVFTLGQWISPPSFVEFLGEDDAGKRFRDKNAGYNFWFQEKEKDWVVPICEDSHWVRLSDLTVHSKNKTIESKEEISELQVRKYLEKACVLCGAKENECHKCDLPMARQRLDWGGSSVDELFDRVCRAGYKQRE